MVYSKPNLEYITIARINYKIELFYCEHHLKNLKIKLSWPDLDYSTSYPGYMRVLWLLTRFK